LKPSDHGAGVLAATEHRWDDAEKQFRIVLDEEPDSASAWSNLGNVHLSKGRPNEAFRDFSEAVRLAYVTRLPLNMRSTPATIWCIASWWHESEHLVFAVSIKQQSCLIAACSTSLMLQIQKRLSKHALALTAIHLLQGHTLEYNY